MALISRLGVVLGLDSGEFNAGLGKAESSLNKFSGLAKGVGVASIAAVGYELLNSAKAAIDFADKIDEVATANQIAIGTILKLSESLLLNGGEADATGKLFATFTNKIDEAAGGSAKAQESFKKLGITLDDLAKLSQQQLFDKVMRGFADPTFGDAITRNAIKMDMLGKSTRQVDIVGVANQYLNNKTNFDNAEKAFKNIAGSMDKLDKAAFKLKSGLAENVAPYFTAIINYLDKALFGYDELIKRKNILEKGTPPQWKATPLITDKPDDGMFNLPKEYQAAAREVTDPEAEKKKTKDKLDNEKKIKEAIANQAEINKINYDIEVARAIELGNLYEQGRLITEDIKERKIIQEDVVSVQVNDLKTQADKIEYQKQLIGLSDTQVQKATELYDLSRETINLYKKGDLEDDQITRIIEAKQQLVLLDEEYKRSQNTFQAGWSKAYANFAERAKDSAAIGADAFDSMSSSMSSAIDRFAETGKISFSGLIQSMIKDLLSFMIKAQASKLFSSLLGSLKFGSFSGGADLAPSATSTGIIGMYADGGEPPVGMPSIVGERGPELFIPKTSGTIIPNHQLSNSMANQPQTVYNGPVIQNMSAIDMQSGIQFLTKNKQAVWSANQSAQRSLPQSR